MIGYGEFTCLTKEVSFSRWYPVNWSWSFAPAADQAFYVSSNIQYG